MRYCSDDFTNLISPSAHHLMTSQFMTGRHVIDILWWLDSAWLSGFVVNFKMFVNTGDVRHDGLPVGALHASHVAGVLKAGIKESHQSGASHSSLLGTGVCVCVVSIPTCSHIKSCPVSHVKSIYGGFTRNDGMLTLSPALNASVKFRS